MSEMRWEVVPLIFVLGVVSSLGNQSLGLGELALRDSVGLHLDVGFLGTGARLLGG